VLVDGIPATMPDGQTTLNHVDLGSLGSAEVERGPASALYGNSAGGVILLETEAPADAPFGARLRALSGANGLSRLQTTLDGRGTAGDWLASVSRLAYDGFRQWSDQRSTRAVGRAGTGSDTSGVGAFRTSVAFVDYDAHNPGGLTDSLLALDPARAFANNVRQQTGESGRHAQVGLSWRRALGAGAIDASAYGLRRRLDNPIPVSIVALARRAGGARATWTSTFADSARAFDARITLGGELQRQRDDRQNFGNAGGARGTRSLDQLEHVTNASFFAQGNATLGRVVVLAGARHDRVRFTAADRLVSATNPDDSGERLMSATTPSLGASVALLPGVNAYANVSTSFETPTTTELANRPTGAGGFNPALDPQRARSIEGGVKGARTLGARGIARWELAAYQTALRDALVPFEVPGAAGRQFFRNAGRARHRGVEASGDVALGAFVARAAYTYVDARFTDYTVRDTSYAGKQVPGVAPRRVDAALEWHRPNGALVALEGRAQARTPATDANRASAAGFATADARATTGSLRVGGVGVAPFAGVTNIFDVHYVTSVTVNAAGARYFEPGAGRTLYVGADVSLVRPR
jgi:iron complex outermembrane receptor protein